MRTDALRAFWRQYRHRQSGKGAGGVVYTVYVTLLAALIYGGPAVVRLAAALHSPDVISSLATPGTASAVSGVLGAVLIGAFVVGTTRGPAVMRPFVVHALVTSDISRRRAFARATVRAGIAVVAIALVVSAVLLGPLADAGAMDAGALVLGLVAAMLFGILITTAWLGGQAATGPAVWAVPAALIAATAASVFVPGGAVMPWSWAAATWPDGSAAAPGLAVALLGAAAAVAIAATPLLLGGLSGPSLVDQARRWEGATVAATTGDIGTAMAEFRAAPTAGRRWRVVRGASFTLAAVRADLVATARMPLRALISALALGGGGWALAAAPGAPGLLRWTLIISASLLLFAGLGPLCDGLRHSVLAITTPRLFGVSDDAMVLARAWAPLIGGVALAGGGAAWAAALRGDAWWSAAAMAAVLVAVLVVVRLDAAAKGAPPLGLTAPIITPFGDLSVVGTVLWQVDAILMTAVAGAALLGLWSGSVLGTWVLAIVVAVALLQWRSRLRKL